MYRYLPTYPEFRSAEGICSRCRGYWRLCGRPICPILIKAKSFMEIKEKINKRELFGASPPSIFIGSWGIS
jgi:hypothetical protein